MRRIRKGGILLEGIVALSIAFTVGFALSGSLLNARKFLSQGQDTNQALDVLTVALAEAHTDLSKNSGQASVDGRTFDWKAVRRRGTGFTEIEVTVFWKDSQSRPHQVSNARIYREENPS
ncbi:hypothetical protein JST97_37870 [bacterium]|nr:hypothetical protein [bacterium]